ncbi:hypothetical protein HLB23_13740 [Nocardia uniformis]|uniref:Uncharacterized protein n=1 Tax=Nocardia uniformis TaxID=53432 RepID=A0A849C7Q2_9NOCA|nr:hypothetical protein [Nocardia uniformis]NNH70909.1 hypothetical protein [Nocardia uniformis]
MPLTHSLGELFECGGVGDVEPVRRGNPAKITNLVRGRLRTVEIDIRDDDFRAGGGQRFRYAAARAGNYRQAWIEGFLLH